MTCWISPGTVAIFWRCEIFWPFRVPKIIKIRPFFFIFNLFWPSQSVTRKAVVGINWRQMYAVMPLWLLRIAEKCMAYRRRRSENLRVHAEASMPASSNHFTILFLAKLLHTKTRYDFRFLATVPCSYRYYPDCAIIYLILFWTCY